MRGDGNRPQFPSPQNVEDHLNKNMPVRNNVQQNSMSCNDKPLFLVQNFDRPSYSGYNNRSKSFVSSGKRKSSSESLFPPRPKQCITEERIASSMQQLNINVHQPRMVQNELPASSSSRTMDEGFYEENLNDFVVEDGSDSGNDDDIDDNDIRGTKQPVMWGKKVSFAPGVKEALKNMDNFSLPNKIIQEMNKSSLALVPYQPVMDDFKLSVHKENVELVYNHNKTRNHTLQQDFTNNNSTINNSVDVIEDETMDEDDIDL